MPRTCLEDLGQVSEVVSVVALGWCGTKVGQDCIVHAHGRRHNRTRQSLTVCRETLQEVAKNGAEDEGHAVVLHCGAPGVNK